MDEKAKNNCIVVLTYFLFVAAIFAAYVQVSDDFSYVKVADVMAQQQAPEVENADLESFTIFMTAPTPFPQVYSL